MSWYKNLDGDWLYGPERSIHQLAIHCAGHAVFFHNRGAILVSCHIDPNNLPNTVCDVRLELCLPSEDFSSWSKRYYTSTVGAYASGTVAEYIFAGGLAPVPPFPENGADDDYVQALTSIQCCVYGEYGDRFERNLVDDLRVEATLKSACDLAFEVLTERWVLVEAIAEALVRKRSLDQAELAKIVDNVQKDMS